MRLLRRFAGRVYRALRRRVPQFVWRLLWKYRELRAETLPMPRVQPKRASGRVCILAPSFFDAHGNVPFLGGAERYLHELVRLLRSIGYEPEVYQPAVGDWIRPFGDLEIIGLDTGGDPRRINEVFHTRVPRPELTIYLAFYLAAPRHFSPSIGISHGIYWDHEFYHETHAHLQRTLHSVLAGLEHVSAVVSVDTNTINWLRTIRHPLSEKCEYVPNFVDLAKFHPRPARFHRDPGELVILFPRRMYEPRGFSLLMGVIPSILDRYPYAVFHVVGQAHSDVQREELERMMDEYPRRVRWDVFPPERMPEAYWAADITVIPTTASEGTSLSCLEAMACGNAIVASDIGGLPNLIIHRYNGLLIKPSATELRHAIEALIEDEHLRAVYSMRAQETAQAFGIDRWRADWQRVVERYLPQRTVSVERETRALVVENPSLEWSRMKQRPQYVAEEFARNGWRVYWRQPRVKDRQSCLSSEIQFVPNGDSLYVERPYVYVFYPYDFEHLASYRDPYVIYDVLDHISIHDESDRVMDQPAGKRARDYHEKLLRTADVVMTSSKTLLEELRHVREDVIHVPNGVDLARFKPSSTREEQRGPRIGFHGALASWVDVELCASVARACPDYEFHFVGPVSTSVDSLRELRNCHILGERPSEAIPESIAGFDVSIAPFAMNTITRHVRPLKVLESLAMRRPVVATPLPELHGWPYVFLARNASEFREAIDQALHAAPRMQHDAALAEFLEANSWRAAVAPLLRRFDAGEGAETSALCALPSAL